jgi:trans-aconitate 2-methyltransferase
VHWDPELYLKFDRARTQPAIDLAAQVELAEPRRIIDVGCGPGNSTAVSRIRWPNADLTGLESSIASRSVGYGVLPRA